MRHLIYRSFGFALCFGFTAHSLSGQSTASTPDFFESKIRPILANNCYGCHTNSAMGGLRVDSVEAMKKGGEHGSVLTPGDPAGSTLITRIKEDNKELRMPKGGKLKAG